MTNKKFAASVGLVLAVVFAIAIIVLSFTGFAHGSTTRPRPNSLGVDQVYTNTNEYLFGVPIDGKVISDGDSRYTNIRFQPYNTMSLYDESVLFCGDVAESFQGKSGPMVVTYDRVGHHMFRGLACHDLVSVFEVHDDQVQEKP